MAVHVDPARRRSLSLLAAGLALVACTSAPTPPKPPTTPDPVAAEQPRCRSATLAVQVLGSGGPIPDDDRASSGYLVWQGGRARVLIDVGGGVFLRFAEAGARIEDLDALLVSHLHADHVADLPALLKGGYFAERKRALPLVGPSANERFPSMSEHLSGLLNAETGAFRYLAGYLTGEDGLFPLAVSVVDAAGREPKTIVEQTELHIEAVGVHHGQIPALGFLVAAHGKRIAFGGDQSAESAAFEKMIHGADLLIAHHALPDRGFAGVTHLHRTPTEIGALASGAAVGRVVLSHNMQRALRKLEEGVTAIRKSYSGPVDVARDLSCYVLVE